MNIPEPVAVTDGIWYVEAPLNEINVTIYVLKGDRLAVIDTGYRFHPEAVIAPILDKLGFPVAEVDLILNTHGHPDHLGGNTILRRLSGAEICLHENDLKLAAGPDAHIHSHTDHISAMFSLGWQHEAEERKQFLYDRVDACEVNHVLKEGELIDLGAGLELQIIHTPGHSDGCVTYYIDNHNIAFTGDAVLGWGVQQGILPLYYDPPAYEQSLHRIQALHADILCLGHNVRWSQYNSGSTPVRRGEEAEQTLEDSKRIIPELNAQVANLIPGASLGEQVESIARALQEPFVVPVDQRGRLPASSAATIISHL